MDIQKRLTDIYDSLSALKYEVQKSIDAFKLLQEENRTLAKSEQIDLIKASAKLVLIPVLHVEIRDDILSLGRLYLDTMKALVDQQLIKEMGIAND